MILLDFFNKSKQKLPYFLLYSLLAIILLLFTISFKNDKKIPGTKDLSLNTNEIELIKDFLTSKIRSPRFTGFAVCKPGWKTPVRLRAQCRQCRGVSY